MILLNSFSLNMLPVLTGRIRITEISPMEVADKMLVEGYVSYVGHADTAALFTSILGLEVKHNRANVTIAEDVMVIVGQYSGPRLPEGCTVLPEGAQIKWVLLDFSTEDDV